MIEHSITGGDSENNWKYSFIGTSIKVIDLDKKDYWKKTQTSSYVNINENNFIANYFYLNYVFYTKSQNSISNQTKEFCLCLLPENDMKRNLCLPSLLGIQRYTRRWISN